MDTISPGTIHTMTVERMLMDGYILSKDDVEAVLLYDEADKELEKDDLIDVFLYNSKENNLHATMQLPEITIGTYGWAEVVDLLPHLGAFMNIGTTKEVLLSYDHFPLFRRTWPKSEDKLFVTLETDRKGRLLAVPASEVVFNDIYSPATDVDLNEQVSGRVIKADREGAVVITDAGYRGFIHHTEQNQEPRLGESITGRVIEVREDATLNISLLPLKHERIDEDAEKILAYLAEADGVIPFTDKSEPEDILDTFKMSKSAFKRALGRLMRDRKIEQKDGKTYSV